MKRIKDHVDSKNPDISLKAIKLALKYKNPEEKIAPVKANQNNYFISAQDSEKKEIIERIKSKIDGSYKVVSD
jgi:ribosomal protein S11